MKKIGILAAVFVVVISGCAKNEVNQQSMKRPFSLLAIAPNSEAGTKTAIASPNPVTDQTNENGLKVSWKAGDEIALYLSTGKEYTFTALSGGSTANFSSEEVDEADQAEGTVYYGLYPHDDTFTVAGRVFSSIIPTNQYIYSDEQQWDPRAPIAVGTCTLQGRAGDIAEASPIQFYNAHALIQMYLPAPASRIMIQTNGVGNLTGKVTVDATNASTASLVSGSSYNYVVMNAEENYMQAKTAYFITVSPCTASSGLAIYATYTESFSVNGNTYDPGNYYYKTTNPKSFVLNHIANIDLTSVIPTSLGGEYVIPGNNHIEQGNYLFFATDGSCTFSRYGGGTNKVIWIEADIYEADKATLITEWSQNSQIYFVQTKETPHTYKLRISGSTYGDNIYLKYDAGLQAFYLVTGLADATEFVIYQV